MPQMMPLYWTPLYLLFSILLSVSLTKIYFSTNKLVSDFNENISLNTPLKLIKWMW